MVLHSAHAMECFVCNGALPQAPPTRRRRAVICASMGRPSFALGNLSIVPACISAAVAALLVQTTPCVAEPYLLQSPEEIAKIRQESRSSVSTPEGMTESELREQSRKNTRVSGKASQQYSLARRYAAAGDIDGALQAYSELLDLAPSFAPAWSNSANILVAKKQYADAITYYTTSLELAPRDRDTWVVLLNRGTTQLALGEVSRALDDMNAALALGNANTAVVYSNRAPCYEAQGKWDMALRDYQRAVEANGNDVQPWWLKYALVLFERDRSQESLSILRRVAARYDASDVHAAMAAIHFSRGEISQAESQWLAVDRPRLFSTRSFVEQDRKWPPKSVDALERFAFARSARKVVPQDQ